ncbi:MAG: hypothetical protein KDE34_05620, partial [Anaerolineales bacterium]|nr:hypothetical protein [Anaerolineales bacterium]
LWLNSHLVEYASSASMLRVGDRIVNADGTEILGSQLDELLEQASELSNPEVTLYVIRDGFLQPLTMTLFVTRDPWIIFTSTAPVVVALLFWVVGFLVFVFSRRAQSQSWRFWFFCLLMCGILASGGSVGWPAQLFPPLVMFFTPLTLDFHASFPLQQPRPGKRLLSVAYAIAVLFAALLLLATFGGERFPLDSFPMALRVLLSSFYLAWLLLGLLGTLYLLMRAFRQRGLPGPSYKLGVVLVSAMVGILPLLALSILPEQLTGRTLVPYPVALIALVAIPLGYGYAIMRFRLIAMERYISRTATAISLVLLLSSLYYLVIALLIRRFPELDREEPAVQLVLILASIVLFNALYPPLRTRIDNLFYGGWYDYSSVITTVANRLDRPQDIESLAQSLSDAILGAMRVHWVTLILPEQGEREAAIGFAGQLADRFELNYPLADNQVLAALHERRHPISRFELLEQIGPQAKYGDSRHWLDHEDATLFVPIYGLSETLGLLILGPKYGGDQFDENDLRILEVVARQASIAFQNAQLIEELQVQARENEAYQRQVLHVREEERRRLARELHDQVIQALIGLRYGLSHIQNSSAEFGNGQSSKLRAGMDGLQADVGQLVQITRNICLDLRPPAVDLGLVPSIRSLVNRFELAGGITVEFNIDGDRAIPVPEDVALCLFRCTQEALQNIVKHAQASKVNIDLTMAPDTISLVIFDDGVGFKPPSRLGILMRDNHFGLVGMREQVELLEGSFLLDSAAAAGTTLRIQLPLALGEDISIIESK